MPRLFVPTNSQSNNRKTPVDLYEKLKEKFNFDFDPCPQDPQFDGLAIDWGMSNFVNPPYGGKNIYRWLSKGIKEWEKGKTCVFLLPSRTGTKWFHELVLSSNFELRFLRGRLRFDGLKINAPFDSLVIIMRQGVYE